MPILFHLSTTMELILIVLSLVLGTLFLETERGYLTTGLCLTVLCALWLGGRLPGVDLSPITLLLYVLPYILIGVFWSVCKWHFYLAAWKNRNLKIIQEGREKYAARVKDATNYELSLVAPTLENARKGTPEWQAAQELPDRIAEYERDIKAHAPPTWEAFCKDRWAFGELEPQPKFKRKMGVILSWATYWPISFVWTMINDPITNMFRYLIFGVLASYFQRVSDQRNEEVESALSSS